MYAGRNKRHIYGVIGEGGQGGRQLLTHRASWLVHRGAIPDGMQVCHRCDVTLCCNPDHLFLGTRSDNMRDCYRKGRLRQAWPTVLNPMRMKAIRWLLNLGWSVEEVAQAFEISTQTVERAQEDRSLEAAA